MEDDMNGDNALPPLVIKGKKIPVPIIQGGMGVGVSLAPLAGAVAREGGMGVVSSACLDLLVSKRLGRKLDTYAATRDEMELARASRGAGAIGINIMVALARDFTDSVRGAMDAGVDAIICGAGLPLNLPTIQDPKDTALIPIVSSGRALSIICKRWERHGYRPDAVVVEGPLAGGHLGFKVEDVTLEENRLENLLVDVKEVAMKHGDIPVIVAGGIYTHDDIWRFIRLGASGVQMATRFLVTHESSATAAYKQAVVDAKLEDIVVAHRPGSPCGLPFRVLRYAPMYVSAQSKARPPRCDRGYVMTKDEQGRFAVCPAKEKDQPFFCVCNGLLSSGGFGSGEEPLYTVGSTANRVDRVMSVKELMDELKGAQSVQSRAQDPVAAVG
jgi:nitronate monooxygenase